MQSGNQNQDLRTIFDSFDLDKNGTIELKELGKIAEQLGEPLSQEELKTIVKLLDTNGDGKISFDEFEYWWIKGKKGKLMRIVQLKAKALKLTNFIKKKFNQANINLQNHKGNVKPDIYDYTIKFGKQSEQCISFNSNFYIQGQKHKQLFQKLKSQDDSISENSLGLLIKLPSKNPSETKIAFDHLINELFLSEMSPIPIEDIHTNPFFKYSSNVKDDHTLISFILRDQILQAGGPMIAGANHVVGEMGADFYACTSVNIKLHTTIDDILDKPLIDNLLKGFCINFKSEANCSSLQKLRKLAQKQKTSLPLPIKLGTLLRASKFQWNMKSPQQVEKFLGKLGIQDQVTGMPLIADLLEEFSGEINKKLPEIPPLQLLKKITHFALKQVENKVQINVLSGKSGCGCIQMNANNVTKIHSIVFNQL